MFQLGLKLNRIKRHLWNTKTKTKKITRLKCHFERQVADFNAYTNVGWYEIFIGQRAHVFASAAAPRPSQLIQRIKGKVGYSLGSSHDRTTTNETRQSLSIYYSLSVRWDFAYALSMLWLHFEASPCVTGFIFSYIRLRPTDGPMRRFMLSKIKTSTELNDIAYCCISLWSQSCPIFGYNILLPQRILKKSYKLLDFSFVIHFIPVMFYTWWAVSGHWLRVFARPHCSQCRPL